MQLTGGSDGRCVRALEPGSKRHSASLLLLNPPSSIVSCYIFVYSGVESVAHFFPFHVLHLDLTFWAMPILLTVIPSQGKLATVVYRLILLEMVRFNGDNRF